MRLKGVGFSIFEKAKSVPNLKQKPQTHNHKQLRENNKKRCGIYRRRKVHYAYIQKQFMNTIDHAIHILRAGVRFHRVGYRVWKPLFAAARGTGT